MKFIIATGNAHKAEEFSRILKPLGIDALMPREAGFELENVEETGETFAQNARLKAEAAFKQCGLPCVADDSGLCVDALGGRPGVCTARYAGENASDSDKYNKLLRELKNVPDEKRSACFVCSICCIIDSETVIEVEGKCFGSISHSPMGEGGFGYDPVFLYRGRSFASVSADEKDAVSHRGKALRALENELKESLIK